MDKNSSERRRKLHQRIVNWVWIGVITAYGALVLATQTEIHKILANQSIFGRGKYTQTRPMVSKNLADGTAVSIERTYSLKDGWRKTEVLGFQDHVKHRLNNEIVAEIEGGQGNGELIIQDRARDQAVSVVFAPQFLDRQVLGISIKDHTSAASSYAGADAQSYHHSTKAGHFVWVDLLDKSVHISTVNPDDTAGDLFINPQTGNTEYVYMRGETHYGVCKVDLATSTITDKEIGLLPKAQLIVDAQRNR